MKRNKMRRVYLVNTFSIDMISNFPLGMVIDKIDKDEFCSDLRMSIKYDEFINAIEHESTVNLVNKLCETQLQKNSVEIKMTEGDGSLIIMVKQSLEEGRVLTDEEIMKMLKEGKIAFYEVFYD